MSEDNEKFWAELDKLNVADVRANLASNVYLRAKHSLASAWLEHRNEASSSEQLLLARRASVEANKANKIAMVALMITAISVIITLIEFLH